MKKKQTIKTHRESASLLETAAVNWQLAVDDF